MSSAAIAASGTPAESAASTLATIAAHRFGYGVRPGEAPAADAAALIAQVRRGVAEACPFPYDGIAGRRASFAQFRALSEAQRQARRDGTVRLVGDRPVNPVQIGLAAAFLRDQHLKVQHAAASPNGFFERLASFWFNHFAVSAAKNPNMRLLVGLYEAEALRPNLAGSFTPLLQAAVLHPAMLAYLDQSQSIGPDSPVGLDRGRGLNENLARELIELHTMGAGSGYSQQDVRAAALVLTGLDYNSWAFETTFRENRAEPGVHRVLGRDYGGPERRYGDVTALLADLSGMEATRRHICRKLVVHFIADDPPPEVVEAMVATWTASDGNLLSVYRTMLEHPRSWEQAGQKARQPLDFVVASLRALDVPTEALAPLPANSAGAPAMETDPAQMAETPPGEADRAGEIAPPITAGSGSGMADPQTVPGAVNMAAPPMTVAGGAGAVMAPTEDGRVPIRANPFSVAALQALGQPLWRPPSPAGWDEGLSAWITASQLTQRIGWSHRLVARFGGDQDPRALLGTVLADAARDDTIEVVTRAPSRQAGLALLLGSPEFNRR
ncbi:DUF1800 domain-containing protein [Mycoplana dimorpha]|uniref:Uncharacterized protein (DUF1800 family) n=1 Tax=Mycoplana dimorpha TaxID=28320 RepID=A0A2T5B8H4_MYCDI|nr:DUF1800 domain-containing protein [Mycoplana dimorpha]PTM95213.1 uncharacterized protein (DUF1800 family) [Mycoplana dimorpha]